jgi:hypothetical protein
MNSAQAFNTGSRQLTAYGLRAGDAGIDVKEFHGKSYK